MIRGSSTSAFRLLRLTTILAAVAGVPSARAETIGHVKLEGRVGFESGRMDEPAFDHLALRDALDAAAAKKCDVVLLEVESGGGDVSIGQEIVKLLRDRQSAGAKCVVWFGLAGSAASWIPFSCPVSVTKPDGRCGGSVMYRADGSGRLQPVEAKMVSFVVADIKNAASAAGRPALLVDAIFEQPREVWLSSDGSLSDRKPTDGLGATCIDSADGVLNMDADTCVKLGFARGTAHDRDAAARSAGLAPSRWVDLTSVVKGRSSRLAAKDAATRKAVHAWFTAIDEMMSKIEDAIVATHATATEYEADRVPDGDIKVLGSRARKALDDHMAKVRDAGSALKFDEAIRPASRVEELFRINHRTMQSAVIERVAEIRKRLAERSTKKAAEAAREAKRLFAELQVFTTTLERPY